MLVKMTNNAYISIMIDLTLSQFNELNIGLYDRCKDHV
jgi:hypothetical protein